MNDDRAELSTALAWTDAVVGRDLLAYLLACMPDSMSSLLSGETPLNEKQVDVATTLSTLRRQIPPELDETSHGALLRNWLVQIAEEGHAVARSLHEHAGGPATVPSARDNVEASLIELALESYSAFLLPPDDPPFPSAPPHLLNRINIAVVSLLHRHAQGNAFMEAVLRDKIFAGVFETSNEASGPVANIYRNTGHGGGPQLVMFAEMLLAAAWRRVSGDGNSPELFAVEAVKELQLARKLLSGESHQIAAYIAFAGGLLPPDACIEIPEGVVRPVADADRALAPESLKAQLTGTDASGTTTVINYDGDILLEYIFPYKIRPVKLNTTEAGAWPKDMLPPANLEQVIMRLRFSFMLAVNRESRAQLVQTWRYFDEPLGFIKGMSWNDPRQGTGIMPVQLTEEEVATWGEWYGKLSTTHADRIGLALGRILRAIAERREPSDVLIDSVIAWENLFGTKEGEPTFRVTMCLAKLLRESLDDRRELKTKLGKIYKLRSGVVHGGHNLQQEEYPLCQEALDVAISAVQTLLTTRADILELPDGALRSAALLLGD